MSSDIFWPCFRVLPGNNPLSIMMGARIIHSRMLDKLYLEDATWLHATLLNNKRVWYLLKTVGEGKLEGKNCRLLGEEDRTQGLTGRTSPSWPGEGSRTRLPLQGAPVTMWQLLWISVFQEPGTTKGGPLKRYG